jgi:hypothetical protein
MNLVAHRNGRPTLRRREVRIRPLLALPVLNDLRVGNYWRASEGYLGGQLASSAERALACLLALAPTWLRNPTKDRDHLLSMAGK